MKLKSANPNENKMSEMAIPRSMRLYVVVKPARDLLIIQMSVDDNIRDTMASEEQIILLAIEWTFMPIASSTSRGIRLSSILRIVCVVDRCEWLRYYAVVMKGNE